MLQPPQRSGLSAAVALEQFKPGLLVGWKLHLPESPFAFYTQHFKGFHMGLNSRSRVYNPTVILASLLEGSVIDDGMWSLRQSDQLKNICLALVFRIFLQQAALPCFSSLLSSMQHLHHDLKTILHIIKFNYLIFFISKLNNRHLREYSFF